MSTVQDAFKVARSLLGDDLGTSWTDATLMPKLVQAHNEMVSKMVLNGLPMIRRATIELTVAIGDLTLLANQPTNLVKPIKMIEHSVGEDVSRAIGMTKSDFLPRVIPAENLRYWSFNANLIEFIGATTTRVVTLFYEGSLAPPNKLTDTLPVPLSETFLGPRVVALCMSGSHQVGGNRDLFEAASQIAETNLSMVVRTEVKGDQSLPARRRPFSYVLRHGRMRY